jgi:hypothetical protein
MVFVLNPFLVLTKITYGILVLSKPRTVPEVFFSRYWMVFTPSAKRNLITILLDRLQQEVRVSTSCSDAVTLTREAVWEVHYGRVKVIRIFRKITSRVSIFMMLQWIKKVRSYLIYLRRFKYSIDDYMKIFGVIQELEKNYLSFGFI